MTMKSFFIPRSNFTRCLLVCIIVILTFTFAQLIIYPSINNGKIQMEDVNGDQNENESKLLKILLWTPLYGDPLKWETHFGFQLKNIEHCTENDKEDQKTEVSQSGCLVTGDHMLLKKSDLIIFNLLDLHLDRFSDRETWRKTILPSIRNPNQLWALFWRESPGQIPTQYRTKFHWLNNLFNWTISYRSDSDVFHPFGFFEGLEKRPDMGKFKKHVVTRKGLTWFSKTCNSSSKVEDFAMNLQKVSNTKMPVKIYGKCSGVIPKVKRGQTFLEGMRKKFRFFLANEEEICEDFITEKYYKALELSFLPIVFGGSEMGYDEIGLSGTYINAFDFDSESSLIEYLTKIQNKTEDFMQYMDWRQELKIIGPESWVCDLCASLAEVKHKGVNMTKINYIKDFEEFWQRKKCYGSHLEAREILQNQKKKRRKIFPNHDTH